MNSEMAQHQQLRNRRRMVFCNGLTHHVHYLRDEYEKYW